MDERPSVLHHMDHAMTRKSRKGQVSYAFNMRDRAFAALNRDIMSELTTEAKLWCGASPCIEVETGEQIA
ncbi:hypothetical protein SARC_05557 [Sphaeroforma arctica JP610]|uniref:Uncharacterized protein n=1 Tax=Sphaeroforma arctica JP610 TaxID=667725 RepID=A0A0L0FZA8_9EUKA|nr:hypothetical protein SARC_05557 [Sphaeroforma arctica JP610]KNC82155.1 hypothetical protein SARC_05557 [Sphaeroforma arctica JP610]|eukprot:XP_014156057.1 hypothetical protein SARC_05557 [Sphaeroforma arctica JP610]